MNGTEERLRDALDAVGETLQPGDVPPPRFAERRRARGFRRTPPLLAAAAAAAAVGVAVGGGVLAGGVLDGTSGAAGPAAAPSASQPDVRTPAPYLKVYLCIRRSPNPACGGEDATEAETLRIEARLRTLPMVERVEYESRQEAYRRFKERFEGSSGFDGAADAGDIPDSFRVWLADPGDRPALRDSVVVVQTSLAGLPGVDRVIVETRN